MPVFPATSATSGGGGTVTLMAIEQATAPRCGPYFLKTQSSTHTAIPLGAFFDDLITSIDLGGLENLYMLRRGYLANGSTVAVAAGDRQRTVDSVDQALGKLVPDRAWVTPPVATELIELHHLDPAAELRPAVLAGLRRCYFEERALVTLSSAAAERDLSAVLGWVTKPSQVRRVQFNSVGSTAIPIDEDWWRPLQIGGHVWLAGWRDVYPNTLYVTALRPHSTWVNGADSASGPTADADLLSLDISYAAAAGHIEAWRLCKARLLQAAEAGFQDSQQDAATEFTSQASANIRRRPRSFGFSAPFGSDFLSASTR